MGRIDSCGTATYYAGEKPNTKIRNVARQKDIELYFLSVRQLKMVDFESFDYIVAMDEVNLKNIQKVMLVFSKAKLRFLLNGLNAINVPDPYYVEKQSFIDCFNLIKKGVELLMNDIEKDVR